MPQYTDLVEKVVGQVLAAVVHTAAPGLDALSASEGRHSMRPVAPGAIGSSAANQAAPKWLHTMPSHTLRVPVLDLQLVKIGKRPPVVQRARPARRRCPTSRSAFCVTIVPVMHPPRCPERPRCRGTSSLCSPAGSRTRSSTLIFPHRPTDPVQRSAAARGPSDRPSPWNGERSRSA